MALLDMGTADGTTIGNPTIGNYFIFLDSNNSNILTTRNYLGVDTIFKSGGLENRVIVNQANVASTLGGTIDSTKEYFIDGVIDMTGVTVTVPSTGIYMIGYNYDVSQLNCTDNTYTMFSSAGAGNIDFARVGFSVSGTSSKVIDLVDDNGTHEFKAIDCNFNGCTSIGDLDTYRQVFMTGIGLFGGSPSLTLSGVMLGGVIFRSSISRGISDSFTGALFQEGAGLTISSRFFSDANIDLGNNCSFIDFQSSNFLSSSSVQLKDMFVTRNSVNDPTDINIIPNLSPSDLVCIWRLNQGILNTFVGGNQALTTETTTTISTSGTFETLAGTWTTNDLQHFDSPSNGQLRNNGESPNEFSINAYVVLDGGANDIITVRIRKREDSTSTFSTIVSQQATINNFQGGNDRCTFTIRGNAVLNMDDLVFLEVTNNSDTTNVTCLVGSYLTVEER